MGAVYEAVHRTLKKRFAIKTLLPAVADNEEARARFLREGEAGSSINHPNVVAVLDVGIEERIPYLVMELLVGQTLAEYLVQRGSVGVSDALALLLPVFSAVATGHQHGVIHRDLKPQNIFLAQGPWGHPIPKVLDFGVSKFAGDDSAPITRTMTVLGTAAYMSPEQARGAKGVTSESDQYSLGLVLYEMLSGRRAHPGDNSLEILHNVASGVIKPLGEVNPDLPDGLVAALARMLAQSPSDRYPSLKEAGVALLPFADAKTQMMLAGAFEQSVVAVVAVIADRGPSLAEHSLAADAQGPGLTEIFPSQSLDASMGTTLGQAAAEKASPESADRSFARVKSTKTWVGVAGALGFVIVGALLWTGKTRAPARPTPAENQLPPEAAGPGDLLRGLPALDPTKDPLAVESTPRVSVDKARATPKSSFEIRAVPAEAEIALDDRVPSRHRLEVVLPLAGSSHTIRVSAPGYRPKEIFFGPDESPPAEIKLERMNSATSPAATGTAVAHDNRARKAQEAAIKPQSGVSVGTNKMRESVRAGAVPVVPKRGSNNALILK